MDEEQKEPRINISLGQVDAFENNPVWKDFAEIVRRRIEIDNNVLRSTSDINTLLRNQGDLVACEFFLNQPSALREEIIAQQEADDKEKEPTDE